MAIFRLEEDPSVFITPHFYENKYVYRMETIDDKSNRRVIRRIDLKKDTLMVYGTPITESMLQKFHDSLILWPKSGILDVNCNGACYFYLKGKGTYRTVHNAIYDWSSFGVVVPNSLNDSLKKQLADKDKEINRLGAELSSYESNVMTRMASLEASKKEVEELKGQLITTNNDLRSTKRLLDVSEKKAIEHTNDISKLKKECEEMEIKLRSFQDRSSSVENELRITLDKLEKSNSTIKVLENELRICEERNSSVESELQSTRVQLDSSNSAIKGLENELRICKERNSSVESELQSTRVQLDSSNKSLREVEDRLSSYKKEMEEKVAELHRVQDELSRIQSKSLTRKVSRWFQKP